MIYFCNIHMKHLQRTSETSEAIEIYSRNLCFQHNISLLLDRMEARRCVVFTGVSGPVALCRWRADSSGCTSRKGGIGRTRPHDLERAVARYAWQGQQPTAMTRRRARAVPGKASVRALWGGRRADKSDTKKKNDRAFGWTYARITVVFERSWIMCRGLNECYAFCQD
jgi:hypothetical protein